MSTEPMTLVERLRNPEWILRSRVSVDADVDLDIESTRRAMTEAAAEIERLQAPLCTPARSSEPRARTAYETFRAGFTGQTECPAPKWEDAPGWIRDAILAGYLQGILDGKARG